MATRWTPNRSAISSAIAVQGVDGQGFERFVFEPFDGPAGVLGGLLGLAGRGRPGRAPGPADEPDDRAVLGRSESAGELIEDGQGEGLGTEFEDATAAGGAATPRLARPT